MIKYFWYLLFILFSEKVIAYNAILYNGSSATSSERLLAMTLAGIVNRDSARLYLLNVYETWSYNLTDENWRDLYISRGNVNFTTTSDLSFVINYFRNFINGGISYDANRTWGNFSGQSFRWQGEYAALIGGLTNRLPVTTQMATQYNLTLADSVVIQDFFDMDSSITVPGRLELSIHPWNNSSLSEENRYLTLLNWGVSYILPRCNPEKFYIREITDFAIKERMFQVNLAGTNSLDLNSMPVARADILENVLTYLQNKNNGKIFHIYGWIYPEPMTQWFAFFGSSFHETLLGNLSWHSSFKVPERNFIPPAKVEPNDVSVENKYYILFITSEGDASNWVFGFQGGGWNSTTRGQIPVTWGWNLHLLDLCPFVAAYYFDTATINDGFISVISPLGYAYPDLWSGNVLPDAITKSKYLMNKFKVEDIYAYKHYAGSGVMTYRGKTISNSYDFVKLGQFQKSIGANLTFLFDPKLNSQQPNLNYGSLLWDHHGDNSFYGDVSNLTVAANNILNEIKKKTTPGFLLAAYNRMRYDNASIPSGSNDITMPRLKQLIQLIKADTIVGNKTEVVTVEKFSALLRKHLNLSKQEDKTEIPNSFELSQNYPNPFNSFTKINYSLKEDCNISIKIYDIFGKEINTPVTGYKRAGNYEFYLDASELTSGVYFYTLIAGNFKTTKKMLLVK